MLVLIVGTGISQSISPSNSKTLDSMWATARQWKVVGGKSRATWDDHPSRGRESFGGCAIRFEITIASVSLPVGEKQNFTCLPKSVHASSKVPWQHMLLLERWLHKHGWTCRASHPSCKPSQATVAWTGPGNYSSPTLPMPPSAVASARSPGVSHVSVILNRIHKHYIYIYTTIYFLYTYICIQYMAGWKTVEYPLVVDTWSHNISQRNIISLNAGNLRLNGQNWWAMEKAFLTQNDAIAGNRTIYPL